MTIRRVLSICALLLSPVAVSSASATRPAGAGSPSAPSSNQFQITDKTEVPGETLKPGTYTIRVVDRLKDRVILQVTSTSGSKSATFLGLPSTGLTRPSEPGPISWGSEAEGKSALRGFSFRDGTVVEFVYPKAEAVSLAKSNDTHVLAIDPASEGKVDLPNLSTSDMQMVTLWLLTPTPVGPGDSGPGISAARYQTASVEAPPRPVRTTPRVAALPHTASGTPLMMLAALLCFGSAAALSLKRLA